MASLVFNMVSNWISRLVPRTLFGRLAMVWLLALGVGHLVQNIYGYVSIYDDQIARTDYYLAQDLSLLLPLLEKAPAAERIQWLEKMRRHAYHYELHTMSSDVLGAQTSPYVLDEKKMHRLSTPIKKKLIERYAIRHANGLSDKEMHRFYVDLGNDQVLIAIMHSPVWPVDWWSGVVFALQVFFVFGFTWLAVRQATLPLQKLADATAKLGSSLSGGALDETGPAEVARAAAAFNLMQKQIKHHLAERVQILAAIAHDLQTPITRMRLRTELMEDSHLQKKLQADLLAMQNLVEEGITFARSAQRSEEAPCRVDVDALLESLAYDYLDAHQQISLTGNVGRIVATRPHTLRRILINLIDNALKFAGSVEVEVGVDEQSQIVIDVMDRGPGIPEAELQAVLQPFYRLEHSRNRETGGTGLGLAIAQQLAQALEGELKIMNRDGGGLRARLVFALDRDLAG